MAYRVYLGGVPAWLGHDDIKWWIWRTCSLWPQTCQIVRKGRDATLEVAFVGFNSWHDGQHCIASMVGRSQFGRRIGVKWSLDSRGPTAVASSERQVDATAASTGSPTNTVTDSTDSTGANSKKQEKDTKEMGVQMEDRLLRAI